MAVGGDVDVSAVGGGVGLSRALSNAKWEKVVC